MPGPVGVPSTPDTLVADYGLNLLAHLLRRAGELLPFDEATETADRRQDARIYLQDAYWWLCGHKPWRWARKSPPLQFVSLAEQVVSVTSIAGATVTLSAVIAATMAGRKFFLDGDAIPHRISAHTAGSNTLTLVTSYTGTGTSGAGRIYQDEITVATDILAYPHIVDLSGAGREVELIPESELRDRAPRNLVGVDVTRTRYAAFIGEGVLRLAPWTATARLFEMAYTYRPDPLTYAGTGAADTPIVPRHFRLVIAWKALENLLRDKQRFDEADRIMTREIEPMLARMMVAEFSQARPRMTVKAGHRLV